MTDERSWFKRFVQDFGKVPEGEPRLSIPAEIRIPVFIGMVAISLVLLALVLWLIVIPAIKAQAVSHAQAVPVTIRAVPA